MEVSEVSYERLFSFERYNNERIGFRVKLDGKENPDEAIGKLYLKVLGVEDCLQAYRQCLGNIESSEHMIERHESEIVRCSSQIADMKISIKELVEKITKGEEDARIQHACNARSLKSLESQLKATQEFLQKEKLNLHKLGGQREILVERIKSGNFTLEGIDIKPQRNYEDFY